MAHDLEFYNLDAIIAVGSVGCTIVTTWLPASLSCIEKPNFVIGRSVPACSIYALKASSCVHDFQSAKPQLQISRALALLSLRFVARWRFGEVQLLEALTAMFSSTVRQLSSFT